MGWRSLLRFISSSLPFQLASVSLAECLPECSCHKQLRHRIFQPTDSAWHEISNCWISNELPYQYHTEPWALPSTRVRNPVSRQSIQSQVLRPQLFVEQTDQEINQVTSYLLLLLTTISLSIKFNLMTSSLYTNLPLLFSLRHIRSYRIEAF